MNQLPIEIPLEYDAKRTRNRLAQRRRREKQKLENATDKETTPSTPQPDSIQLARQQRSVADMSPPWEQSRDTVQLTSAVSLQSWCPANHHVSALSPWLESRSPASTVTSPGQGGSGQGQGLGQGQGQGQAVGEDQAAAFFLNTDVLFQSDAALLVDPLLRPTPPLPVIPSSRRYSTSHPGQAAAVPGVSSSTYGAAPAPSQSPSQSQSQDHDSTDQTQAVLSRSAFHSGGGAAVKRHSIAGSSISSVSSISPINSASSAGPSPSPSASWPLASSPCTISASTSTLTQSSATAVPSPPSLDLAAERSIARILIMADEMGFESFEELAATYYTARFSEGSLPRYAQSASRSRRLCGLLTDLHASSREWVGREARGYHDGQTRLLETVCVEEFGNVCGSGRGVEQSQRPIHHTQAFITNMIRQLFTEEGAEKRLDRDTRFLKEQMPSLWSLLSQVAQQTDSGAEDTALAICVFVYMLQVPL
ncbi:hypothetical protein E4U21_002837 [Claviceps maximensis]|nr:hypothetical protein E4U21_002837 [Claviceps maximensis]